MMIAPSNLGVNCFTFEYGPGLEASLKTHYFCDSRGRASRIEEGLADCGDKKGGGPKFLSWRFLLKFCMMQLYLTRFRKNNSLLVDP